MKADKHNKRQWHKKQAENTAIEIMFRHIKTNQKHLNFLTSNMFNYFK